jgi:hypothetical protein
MFEGWDDFFLLIGGASGGLIGLLFIVITLIRGASRGLQLRAASAYMTPTVAHLTLILVMSAWATAPHLTTTQAAWVFILGSLACMGFTGRALYMLWGGQVTPSHWSDVWGYGVLPLLGASMLAGFAGFALVAPDQISPQWSTRGIAAALAALLMIAVRNAWDLVTWITAAGDQVERHDT